jgi:hypothetical protein
VTVYYDESEADDAALARHAAAVLIHAELAAERDEDVANDARALAVGSLLTDDKDRCATRMQYLVQFLSNHSGHLLLKGGWSFEDAVQYAWANVEKTRPDYDVLARGESLADPVDSEVGLGVSGL